jgi:hypothetical protein
VILILFWTGLNGFLVVMDWMMRPSVERWILHFDHDDHLTGMEDVEDSGTNEVSESEFEDPNYSGHEDFTEPQIETPE